MGIQEWLRNVLWFQVAKFSVIGSSPLKGHSVVIEMGAGLNKFLLSQKGVFSATMTSDLIPPRCLVFSSSRRGASEHEAIRAVPHFFRDTMSDRQPAD